MRASCPTGDPVAGDSIASRLNTLVAEAEKKLVDILGYFGIAEGKQVRLYRVANEDVELLRKAGVSEDDIQHCLAVAGKALEIAHRTGAALDLELIGRGALMHDLGKVQNSRDRAREARSRDGPKTSACRPPSPTSWKSTSAAA